MKYCNFIKSELDYFRSECNFTDMEREYFDLRARDKSNVEIQFIMHLSENQVRRISKNVKQKVNRVIPN